MMKPPSIFLNVFNTIGAISPPKDGHYKKFFMILYFIRLFLGAVLFIFVAIYYVLEPGRIIEKLSSLQYFIAATHIFSKQIHFFYQKNEFYDIIKDLDYLCKFAYKSEKGIVLLKKEHKMIKRMSSFLLICILVVCPLYVSSAIISHILYSSNRIPFKFYTPFNSFWGATITQIVLITSGSLFYSCYLCVFATITFLISSQMDLLKQVLISGELNKNNLKLHQDILKIISRTNKLISGVLAFEMLLSCAQSSSIGYAFIIEFKQHSPLWLELFYVFLLTICAVFVPCFFGNIITRKSEEIFIASYQNNWYTKSIPYRNDLFILSTMASKTLSYNYRNLVDFNMELFATFLRGTYAYLSSIEALPTSEAI